MSQLVGGLACWAFIGLTVFLAARSGAARAVRQWVTEDYLTLVNAGVAKTPAPPEDPTGSSAPDTDVASKAPEVPVPSAAARAYPVESRLLAGEDSPWESDADRPYMPTPGRHLC